MGSSVLVGGVAVATRSAETAYPPECWFRALFLPKLEPTHQTYTKGVGGVSLLDSCIPFCFILWSLRAGFYNFGGLVGRQFTANSEQ
eukprot:515667-Amphidinium_carterae.1